MPSPKTSSVNLLLPVLPATKNAELFNELVKVYNAINLLANSIDANAATSAALIPSVDYSAQAGQLQKIYYKYKVPRFTITGALDVGTTAAIGTTLHVGTSAEIGTTLKVDTDLTVVGKAGFNGKSPQLPGTVLANSNAPAGGVGTAAGGWDTAANRNTAIQAINDHAFGIQRITDTLVAWGIMKP